MNTVNDGFVLNTNSVNSFGSVAQRLLANKFNINALRTNDVLQKDEWILFDQTVVGVARSALLGVSDLMEANLQVTVPNAMGVTVVQHQTSSDLTEAQIDMSGLTEGERDRLKFELVSVPLPIIHKDFNISLRNLESSRRMGMPLDTTTAAVAARRVSDAIENMLFQGASISAGGGTIYGYTNAPNRNTGSVTADWVTATGEQILGDLLAMIEMAQTDNMFGPYQLYVSVPAMTHLLGDFKTNSDKSILQRLSEVPSIRAIKATTRLAGTNVLLVQFTSDVVDILEGLQPTTVFWESHGGMQLNFKVMAILAPRIKSTQLGQSGLVHFS